ncbi:MAG: phosphoribosyltransferase family protein [Candidatus Bathyarchaeia archaeon]
MSGSHVSDLKFRLMTIDLLRMAKKKYTYRELSGRTGLPVTVLSRYVKGHVLPSSSRAKTVWKTLEKLVGLEEELRRRIRFDEYGYFDNSSIISDPALLQQGAQYVFSRFAGRRITKVMTAAVDGIPLATLVSEALGTEMVIAKKAKDVGIRDYIEETYIPGNSAIIMSLYIPRNVLKRGEGVLIVDDIIKSGETQKALVNLVDKCRAEVAGIYALIGVGDEWRHTLGNASFPVEVVLTIKPGRL